MPVKIVLAVIISLLLQGCGVIFSDSYEADAANDTEILQEIIKANPILDSVPESFRFFYHSPEYGILQESFSLNGLGLNDSNFYFPKSIGKFRIIKTLYIYDNNFTELPRGCRYKNWEKIVLFRNKICNPSKSTIEYLDEKTRDNYGGYWLDQQICTDTINLK